MFCNRQPDSGRCSRCGRIIGSDADRIVCITEADRAKSLQVIMHGQRIRIGDINLGDKVASILGYVGITDKTVMMITGARDCGCPRRRNAMNDWSNKVAFFLERSANRVADFMLGDYISEEAATIARRLTIGEVRKRAGHEHDQNSASQY